MHKPIAISFLLSILAGPPALAKDRCTLERVSNQCQHFQPDGKQFVEFPDGSVLPNFARINGSEGPEGSFDHARDNQKDSVIKKLNLESELAEILDQMKFSRKSRVFWGPENLANLSEGHESEPILTPWPLHAKNPKVQWIARQEVRNEIKKQIDTATWEHLQQKTEDWKSLSGQQKGEFASKEVLQKLQPTEKSKKRMKELFSTAKSGVLKFILKDRTQEQLSARELALFQKVKDVQLLSPEKGRIETNCSRVLPNAFYAPDTNQVSVCPSMYNYPAESILWVLAHELGHAIDPCSHQHGIFHVYQDRLQNLVSDFSVDGEVSDVGSRLMETLEGASGKKTVTMPLLTSLRVKDQLVKRGAVQRITSDIKFENYPFKEVYACFASEQGGGFNKMSGKSLEQIADTVVKTRRNLLGSSYNSKADRKNILKALNHTPECSLGTGEPMMGASAGKGSSNMGEVMSDWVASEVLGDYLKKNPPKTDLERLAPLGMSIMLSCQERMKAQATSHTLDESIHRIFDDVSTAQAAHPVSPARLERIIMAHPDVAEAYQCTPVSAVQCSEKRVIQPSSEVSMQPIELGGVN